MDKDKLALAKLSPERGTALIGETGFKAEPMTFSQAR